MNLSDTVEALEVKGITVAIDIGVHGHCSLDTNCPVAVQLRRLIADAGITLEQLLEGYQEVTAPNPVHWELPVFDTTFSLNLGGKSINVDFNDVISGELKHSVEAKLGEIERLNSVFRNLGRSLYNSYLSEISHQRDNLTLPQISFSIRELLETGCLITSQGKEYTFLFLFDYNPQYLVNNGIRYKMSDRDIADIKRKAYLMFVITKEGKFLYIKVLDGSGAKLEHYHGNRREDCWGVVILPQSWDGELTSLIGLVRTLSRSLITINMGSLLMPTPPHMPSSDSLLEGSTKLGVEGEIAVSEDLQGRQTGWGGRGWGRRGQGEVPQTENTVWRVRDTEGEIDVPLTEEEQQMERRFDTRGTPDYDAICNLCGATYGGHHGFRCPNDGRQE